MRILFYMPFSTRSRDTESVILAFKNQGHDVMALNQTGNSQINSYLRTQGIAAFEHQVTSRYYPFFYARHILYLIYFCIRHKIDIVYSHLEPAGFAAVIAQYFIKAKVYVCRHHEDLFRLTNRDQYFTYKATYRYAKKIIVVSQRTKKYMVENEGIEAEKIVKINLGYDFSLYNFPSVDDVRKAKEDLRADIILITVGQLIESKQPQLAVAILDSLVKRGLNAKLILLGRGVKLNELKDNVTAHNLCDRVIMPGHVDNVMQYIATASFLVHPSISESSCVVVKEAALMNIPVIVVKGVGDFDDYIEDRVNGFLIDRSRFVEESVHIIEEYSSKPEFLKEITDNLKHQVIRLFSIDNTIKYYDSLNS